MEKKCPNCGAELPEGASFCPHCAQSINDRTEPVPPKPFPRKAVYAIIAVVVAAAVALGVWLMNRPKTYEGLGEVIYADDDGTYQLVLAWPSDRYQPITEIHQNMEEGENGRFPIRLYINHKDSGADAGQLFLQKVDSVIAEFIQAGDNPSPWKCSEPAPHDAMPDATLITLNDFNAASGDTEQVWTIHMKNGDTIRLRVTIYVHPIPTYHYYPENAPMDTTEDLQALIDQISGTVEENAVVYLHLPAVTYGGSLVIQDRPINLCGNTEGERRTVFTGSVRVTSGGSYISFFDNIDFAGSGSGVGISASARLHLTNCNITGWKTGVLAYGYTWVNVQTSHFANNTVGFHFNADGSQVSHTLYTGNEFVNNGTAVLLESVPTDVAMTFGDCLFSGNDTDIDNRCDQSLDVSGATFE